MKNPLVSIVIPAYQAERFIEETINSVIDQAYANWELIVINDGSKDNTAQIVQTFCDRDNRISLHSIENSGVSIARNEGIKRCKGELVAFLDADDVWLPENLREKVEVLNAQTDIDWVFSDMNEADEQMVVQGVAPIGRDDDILDNILLWEGEVVPGPCSNILVRRKFISENIWYDKNISTAADQDFCIQLVANGLKGHRIAFPLWNYRVLGGSMSRNIKVMEEDHIYVFKKADKLKLYKSWTFKQQCFSNLYLILAANWWGDGKNKVRGIYFGIKSILTYPPTLIKVFKKVIKS